MKLKRFFVLSAALAGLAFTASADLADIFTNAATASVTAIPRRPSMVLIVCHGLGYGDLSCYGQTNYQTPNLDRLAAGGMRFTSYYAGNADNYSSRAVLLTGQNSTHLPQRADQEVPLSPQEYTLAQRLKQVGYHTGFIGEWGLGSEPWLNGFDEFAGFLTDDGAKEYYPDSMWRYAPNLGHNPTNHVYEGPAAIYVNKDGKKGQLMSSYELMMMSNFIKNNQPDKFNHYQPFFLVVNVAVPRSATTGSDDFPVATDAPYSDEPWPPAAKNRVALISQFDTAVGGLFQCLEKNNLSNTVAVFFTSDAGPEKFANPQLNFLAPTANFRGARGDLYEGGLRVPMIACWAGHIPAGQTSDVPWAAWDFVPTALDIGYIKPPADLAGTSVWPVLQGATVTNRNEVFQWTLNGTETTKRAARFGNWKVVQNGTNAPEIYDLSVDPQERTNVPNATIAAQFAALPQ